MNYVRSIEIVFEHEEGSLTVLKAARIIKIDGAKYI